MTASTIMDASDTTVYAKWNLPASTTKYNCTYSGAVNVAGYDTLTVTITSCGNHITAWGTESVTNHSSLSIGTTSGSSNLKYGYHQICNEGMTATIDVSAYSTVYVGAAVTVESYPSGAKSTCSNCTVTIKRY